MNPLLGAAIYVIVWWLVFFTVLPIGAQSPHEGEEASVPGVDRGAPKAHNLRLKALLAGAIAAVVWLGVAWGVSVDLFHMRG